MDVTVIIVTWNSQDVIRKCLEKLFNQTLSPSRIVVLDNDSSDSTVTIAREFSGIDVLCMDDNLGFAKGNNIAVKQCDTKWVALLNPDAFPEKKWLESLFKATINYPDITVFGSLQLSETDNTTLDGTGDSYHISGMAWREDYGLKLAENLNNKEIFSPCAAAALYQREAFNHVGGFDEDYFCYMEDVDLGFRLRLYGHKALLVSNAIVHHVGSASTGGQHSDFSIYHGHRNLVWTYIKDMPGLLIWLLLPAHIAMNIFTIIWFTVKGKSKVILKAKWDALKQLPREWSKRQKIQQGRLVEIDAIWKILDKSILK